MEILKTERLILEPICLDHSSETYLSWLNDSEVYKWMETRGYQTFLSLNNIINNKFEIELTWGL